MRLTRILEDRLGFQILASNRRPFAIDVTAATCAVDGVTVAIRATNPYSGASWWWIFMTSGWPDLSIVSVVTDGAFGGQAATNTDHVPGNLLDVATTIIAQLRERPGKDCPAPAAWFARKAEASTPVSGTRSESGPPPSRRS